MQVREMRLNSPQTVGRPAEIAVKSVVDSGPPHQDLPVPGGLPVLAVPEPDEEVQEPLQLVVNQVVDEQPAPAVVSELLPVRLPGRPCPHEALGRQFEGRAEDQAGTVAAEEDLAL